MAGLSVKNLVEICTQYEIKKIPLNMSNTGQGAVYGLCCPTSKTIYLEPQQDVMEMRDSFIHECFHAYHFMKGDLYGLTTAQSEKVVLDETKALMRRLYGRKR